MLIDVITDDATHRLLNAVERSNKGAGALGVLHFMLSRLPHPPGIDGVLPIVRRILEDKPSTIYRFDNGDVILTWSGSQRATRDALCTCLYDAFGKDFPSPELHSYYDSIAHAEDIRQICSTVYLPSPKTTDRKAEHHKPPTSTRVKDLQPRPDQMRTFTAATARRSARQKPEILVVEDQLFSRKLLLGLLDRSCRAYGATDVQSALDLYWSEAPDMVFLDIDLPDGSGHGLAAVLAALDPDSHIVMVTANSQPEDIQRARSNRVKGFIVKPYNRGKILEAVEKFRFEHRDRKPGASP